MILPKAKQIMHVCVIDVGSRPKAGLSMNDNDDKKMFSYLTSISREVRPMMLSFFG